MVGSLEEHTQMHHFFHKDKRTTIMVIVCTAACTLEGFKKSVSPLIRSIDKKLLKYKFTAAIRNFSVNFYIKRLAPYVESMLIDSLRPGLTKVRLAGLNHKSIINTKHLALSVWAVTTVPTVINYESTSRPSR